jgi:4-amino-4-deoxy-L-arabinose transferase-like glycosyltransferase
LLGDIVQASRDDDYSRKEETIMSRDMIALPDHVTENLTLTRSPLWFTRLLKGRMALWLILLLALATRLYSVNAPLTDGGQERQTQVAMIARNLYRENLNVLYPRMDTSAPEPGYTMLEFPLQSALMAIVYYFVGVQDIVGRLITITFSIASILFMYELAKFFLPERGALLITSIYALTPMSIYFGRTVFPEALLLFFSLGALYFMLRWSEGLQKRYYWLSLGFAATASLVKAPPGLVMMLPLSAVWWVHWRQALFRRVDFYVYFGAAVLPIALWGIWSTQVGVTDPSWNPYQLSAISRWGIPGAWFTPTFYFWVSRSLVVMALTPLVALLGAVGLLETRRHRLGIVVYMWVIAMIVFVFLTPGAQATHWNYQVPLIPIGALLAGFGVYGLANSQRALGIREALNQHRVVVLMLAVLVLLGYGAIYAVVIRDAYNISKRVPVALEVGKIVQKEIPNEGFLLLIQPAMVATTQAYYMDRKVR